MPLTTDKKPNKYALLNFKRDSDPDLNALQFQTVVFYELREDGSFDNGTTIEEMLCVSIERLQDLNGRFPCRENSIAITKLQEAWMWLTERTADRVRRGVEGKHLQ
mgnify:CR=1 FL=1